MNTITYIHDDWLPPEYIGVENKYVVYRIILHYKGKPRNGQEDPDGGVQRRSSNLSLTSALNVGGWPRPFQTLKRDPVFIV